MIIFKIIIWVTVFYSTSALADPNNFVSIIYYEAIHAYRDGNLSLTFRDLDFLLKEYPNCQKFLELKALALKKYDCLPCTEATFEKLMNEPKINDTEAKGTCPAFQEQPLLRAKLESQLNEEFSHAKSDLVEHLKRVGKTESALRLNRSIASKNKPEGVTTKPVIPANTTVTVAHFLQAMAAFQAQNMNEATSQFLQAIDSGDPKVIPASYFYLAKIRFIEKENYPALRSLELARSISDEQIQSKTMDPETVDTATQIYSLSSEMYSKYNVSGFFGTATLLMGYDSNVLAVPSYTTSVSTTGNSSITSALSAGYGYSSSPAKPLQFVTTYRMSTNYNFNSSTLAGEFMNHDISIIMTRHALDSSNFGIRLEPVLVYQNQRSEITGNASFALYSYQLQAAPFLKASLEDWLSLKDWILSSEFQFSYHHEFGDAFLSSEQWKRGPQYTLRTGVSNTHKGTFWNPSFGLTLDYNNTSGTEYRDFAYGFDVKDLIHLSEKIDATASLALTTTSYPMRPEGPRNDRLLVLGVGVVDRLTPKWNLLANVQFTDNFSNILEVYAYNKLAISSGINFNF